MVKLENKTLGSTSDRCKKKLLRERQKYQTMLLTTSRLLLDGQVEPLGRDANVLEKRSDDGDQLTEPHRRDLTHSAHLHRNVDLA